jgi:hypothetical protein
MTQQKRFQHKLLFIWAHIACTTKIYCELHFHKKIKFPSVKISSSLLCKNAPTNVFKILQKRIKKVNFIKFQNIQFLIRPCGLTIDCVSLKIDWRKKEIGHSSVNCSSLQKCPNIFFYIHGQSPVLPNLLLL